MPPTFYMVVGNMKSTFHMIVSNMTLTFHMIVVGHLHEGPVERSGQLFSFFKALAMFVHVVARVTVLWDCQNQDSGVPKILLRKRPEMNMNAI